MIYDCNITTQERLLASQRRAVASPRPSNRRRLSRDRPSLPQVININREEYLSDSADSLYGSADINQHQHQLQQQQQQQQPLQQQSLKIWLQQHQDPTMDCELIKNIQSRDGSFLTLSHLSANKMRAANSLDSLDVVTNSIQQARANSLQRGQCPGKSDYNLQCFASPQLLRINRSNSMRFVRIVNISTENYQSWQKYVAAGMVRNQ